MFILQFSIPDLLAPYPCKIMVQEIKSILPFAMISVDSVLGFTMVVYEKIFGSINK